MMNIDEVLTQLEKEAQDNHVPIIRKSERMGLLNVAKQINPSRILEIGTAIGYSSLLLLSHFPQAMIDSIELDEVRYQRACKAVADAGVNARWRGHLGDASQILPTLTGPYDFVFLDGPKGQYLRELKIIEPMLATKAMVVADNVLFRGLVQSHEPVEHRYRTIVNRLREYIDYVTTHYDTVIDDSGDGFSVSIKRT